MNEMDYKQVNDDMRYLTLLSRSFPNIATASTEIINLEAILNLQAGGQRDGAGRGFRHYGEVHHLILCQPPLFLHAGIGDHGDHGVSAAKGKQPYFHKTEKELREHRQRLTHVAVPPMRPHL